MAHTGLPPIDVTVVASSEDPRSETAAPEGVVIHRVPALHPEDVVTLPCGLRVTSVARTLIDLAEVLPRDELRDAFVTASTMTFSMRPRPALRRRARLSEN
jgi:hypothetical protein